MIPSSDQPPSDAGDPLDRIARNAEVNLAERRAGCLVLRSRPQVVYVELSRRCNLACPMCHRWELPRSSFVDMDEALIRWLEVELFPTARIVDLHGLGESTLHPAFPGLVRRIAAMGPRVRLVTNLNGMSTEAMTALVESDAYVCFSLGALGQRNYSLIYARGNFAELSSRLRAFQVLRGRSGACQDMSCMTMLSRANIGELEEVMRFVHDHGVRHHRIFPMYLREGDPRYVGRDMATWEGAIARAFDLADSLGMEVRVIDWPLPLASSKTLVNFTCHRPWTHIHVNVDGVVGLCDYNEHVERMQQLVAGKGSADDVWNSEVYQAARRAFLDGIPSRFNSFCGDVCRWTKYVDFDDLILPELASRVLSNRNRGT